MDVTQEIMNAIRDATLQGITNHLKSSGYGSPVGKFIDSALQAHAEQIRRLFADGIKKVIDNPEFVTSIHDAVRTQLAKALVQSFGGELQKQVNALKSDPTTRARITIALEEIVAGNKPTT